MLRRNLLYYHKLVVVESPVKRSKLEALFNRKGIVPDWSFGGKPSLEKLPSFPKPGGEPEQVLTVATGGHFMTMQEIMWHNVADKVAEVQPEAAATEQQQGAEPHQSLPAAAGTKAAFNLLWETTPKCGVQDAFATHLGTEEQRNEVSEIIVATDPDREGELIGVQAYQLLCKLYPNISIPFSRAYIHALTAEGVVAAMESRTTKFDWQLSHAASARHAMDRIFGFLGSTVVRHAHPLMRSVGRVQTPSLILIRERERRIEDFKLRSPAYYVMQGVCCFPSGRGGSRSSTQTAIIRPVKDSHAAVMELSKRFHRDDMERLMEEWGVRRISSLRCSTPPKLSVRELPAPSPLTMAAALTRANSMHQIANGATALALQELFQNGYITYPRTDSTRIEKDALEEIYKAVTATFGASALQRRAVEAPPPVGAAATGGRVKKQMNVEDAHEAIRPSDITVLPGSLPTTLSRSARLLYDLIHRQTLASCMAPAEMERVQVVLETKGAGGVPLQMVLEGKRKKQGGWPLAFSSSAADDSSAAGRRRKKKKAQESDEAAAATSLEEAGGRGEDESPDDVDMPMLSNDDFDALSSIREGSEVTLKGTHLVKVEQTPPQNFSEGTLISELQRHGVGRPSTYPTIVSTLLERQYIVMNEGGRCETTDVGKLLVEVAQSVFPGIVNIHFTSEFEGELEGIAKSPAEEHQTREGSPAAAESAEQEYVWSPMDRVLSRFTDRFFGDVVDATKRQRAKLAELSVKQLTTGKSSPSSSAAEVSPDMPERVRVEQERAISLIPDLGRLSMQYRSFTAVQNNLKEFLWRNFPRLSTPSLSSAGAKKMGRKAPGGKARAAGAKKAKRSAKKAKK